MMSVSTLPSVDAHAPDLSTLHGGAQAGGVIDSVKGASFLRQREARGQEKNKCAHRKHFGGFPISILTPGSASAAFRS